MRIRNWWKKDRGAKIGLCAFAAVLSLIVAAQATHPPAGSQVNVATDQAFDSSGTIPSGCSQFMIVNVRGTRDAGDTSNRDAVTVSFAEDFTNTILADGMSASARSSIYITYDTPTLNTLLHVVGIPHDLHSGVVNTDNYLLPELNKCWNSIFILDGYSFGAWIVKDVYNALPDSQRQRVLVVAFGDPTFDPLQGWDDAGTYQLLPGIYEAASFAGPYAARAGRDDPYPGYSGPQVHDTCLRDDLVCQSFGNTAVHENDYPPLWTLDAAIWAFNRWQAGIPV